MSKEALQSQQEFVTECSGCLAPNWCPIHGFYVWSRGATEARTRFSEAFLLHKNRDPKKPLTDREAEHRAYIDCGAERDMAEARLEVARLRLLGTL